MSENNNPQNPEGGEETVSLSKKEYEELTKKAELADKSVEDKNKLVSEITELREKKRISEEQYQNLLKKQEQNNQEPQEITPEFVQETVQRIFEKQSETQSKENKELAIKKFKSTYKEFSEDNDPGGIKFSAIENEFNSFNLDGLKSVDDFLTRLEKAKRLVLQDSGKEDDPQPVHDEDTSGGNPPLSTNIKLSSKEEKIINDSFGGDKERYLKIKASKPDYVDSLLEWAK